MSTNKKLLTLIISMLAIVSIASALIFTYNFKSYSFKMVQDRALSIAQNVRDGLTSHMITGTINQRETYLNNIKNHQNVDYFHLLRSQTVIDQYGKGFDGESTISSELEEKVLKTKEVQTKLFESYGKVLLKISIPYIATSTDKPNCMQCHNAKEGDVLGALSMDIDITDIRNENILILFKIFLAVLIISIISLYIIKRFTKPYTKLFNDLEESISCAYKGDFTYKIETKLNNEAFKVANQLNELTEIYKFKKTIELDQNKDEIYNRLIHILHIKFKIDNFILFEVNSQKKKRTILYNSTNNSNIEEAANVCRAFRTNTDVFSSDFDDICLNCDQKTKFYMCFNFIIDDEYYLVLHIQESSQEALDLVKKDIPVIQNYLDMAKPVIESKILLTMLKDTTLKDPMTKLYNRRFLDELIQSNISSRVKEGALHSILMLDIDLFKKVNDTYGHDVGDEVIKRLAKIMKQNVRDSDMAVRYGGEEFIILLMNTTQEKTLEIANQINQEFAKEEFVTNLEIFKKTVSIGISSYPKDTDNLVKAIKLADEALYLAKNTGRDKVIEYKNKEI
jgi:diguanylate cyclase (GGDEF)-like protein